MNTIAHFTAECQADMRLNGLSCDKDLIFDGKIQRYSCDENILKEDEWYVGIIGVTSDGREYLICTYGSWSNREKNFTYKSFNNMQMLSDYEKEKIRSEIKDISERVRIEGELRVKIKHDKAARLLSAEYQKMNLLPHSGKTFDDYIRNKYKYTQYLQFKRIKQYECVNWPIKFLDYYDKATDKLCPAMAIPLINVENKLRSVEYIYYAGGLCRKQFRKDCEKKGNFYPLDGHGRLYSPYNDSFSHALKKLSYVSRLYITEGYATAASIFEALQRINASGWYVIVAFDAGNICPVVGSLRTKFSTQEIIICVDDDEAGCKAANTTCQMYNCTKILT